MPAPLAVDREQVRMLHAELGAAEVSRRTGIPEGTIRQWARREGWNEGHKAKQSLVAGFPTPAKAELAATLPASLRPVAVAGVTKPADALSEILAEDERETRLSLSRAARKLSRDGETARLDQAGDVLQTGKLAALVHRWEASDQAPRLTLNLYGVAGEMKQVRDV